MSELILTMVMAFLAGLIAQVMTPGLRPFGPVATTAIGIGGFVLATVIGHWLTIYDPSQYAGFLATLVTVLSMLTLYRLVAPRKNGSAAGQMAGYGDIAASHSGRVRDSTR